MKTQRETTVHTLLYPLLTGEERIALWQGVKGMWKHRKPDAALELRKIRKELDRKNPHVHA